METSDLIEELSSEIYVNADVTRDQLAQAIARHLGVAATALGDIRSAHYYILVNRNLGFDEQRQGDPRDAFLYYRYYLNVEARPGQNREHQVQLVGNLLTYLWSQDWQAVAVCDYHDELPKDGGYGGTTGI